MVVLTLALLWAIGMTSLAWSGAAGDFNGDGFADLAIGVPFESIGTLRYAGTVNVLYGSAAGLSAAGNQLFSQDTPGILGAAELGDAFGHNLEFFPPGEY